MGPYEMPGDDPADGSGAAGEQDRARSAGGWADADTGCRGGGGPHQPGHQDPAVPHGHPGFARAERRQQSGRGLPGLPWPVPGGPGGEIGQHQPARMLRLGGGQQTPYGCGDGIGCRFPGEGDRAPGQHDQRDPGQGVVPQPRAGQGQYPQQLRAGRIRSRSGGAGRGFEDHGIGAVTPAYGVPYGRGTTVAGPGQSRCRLPEGCPRQRTRGPGIPGHRLPDLFEQRVREVGPGGRGRSRAVQPVRAQHGPPRPVAQGQGVRVLSGGDDLGRHRVGPGPVRPQAVPPERGGGKQGVDGTAQQGPLRGHHGGRLVLGERQFGRRTVRCAVRRSGRLFGYGRGGPGEGAGGVRGPRRVQVRPPRVHGEGPAAGPVGGGDRHARLGRPVPGTGRRRAEGERLDHGMVRFVSRAQQEGGQRRTRRRRFGGAEQRAEYGIARRSGLGPGAVHRKSAVPGARCGLQPEPPPLEGIRREGDPARSPGSGPGTGGLRREEGVPVDVRTVGVQGTEGPQQRFGLGSCAVQRRHREGAVRGRVLLGQRGQHRARTDLDERVDPVVRQGAQGVGETHRPTRVAHPVPRVGQPLRADESTGERGHQRHPLLPGGDPLRERGRPGQQGVQLRGVERPAGPQPPDPRPAPPQLLRERGHRPDRAREHGVLRPVDGGDGHVAPVPGQQGGDRLLGCGDRHHRPVRGQPAHQPSARGDQSYGIVQADGTAHMGGRDLPQGVPRDIRGTHPPGHQQPRQRGPEGEQRGLGELGAVQ